MKAGWFILCAAFAASACKMTAGVRYEYPPHVAPAVGSVVELAETIEVPGGWARVFLQRGRVVSYRELDHYHPSCNFELRTLSEGPQDIAPGRYRVTRVRRQVEEVVQGSDTPYKPVAFRMSNSTGFDSSPSMVMQVVHLYLEGENQPELFRLSCRGALAMPYEAEWPRIDEIREALGKTALLELAPETGGI